MKTEHNVILQMFIYFATFSFCSILYLNFWAPIPTPLHRNEDISHTRLHLRHALLCQISFWSVQDVDVASYAARDRKFVWKFSRFALTHTTLFTDERDIWYLQHFTWIGTSCCPYWTRNNKLDKFSTGRICMGPPIRTHRPSHTSWRNLVWRRTLSLWCALPYQISRRSVHRVITLGPEITNLRFWDIHGLRACPPLHRSEIKSSHKLWCALPCQISRWSMNCVG